MVCLCTQKRLKTPQKTGPSSYNTRCGRPLQKTDMFLLCVHSPILSVTSLPGVLKDVSLQGRRMLAPPEIPEETSFNHLTNNFPK